MKGLTRFPIQEGDASAGDVPAVSRNPMPIAAVQYVVFTNPSVNYASGADCG